MKRKLAWLIAVLLTLTAVSCRKASSTSDMNILFLHHSTGAVIWRGAPPSTIVRAANKISSGLAGLLDKKPRLPQLFEEYNRQANKHYRIEETAFPKMTPYGWHNYPYDYYNIWVRHSGENSFMEEPTLEMLTKEYQVIIFKHCFPVSNIDAGTNSPDINSDQKTLPNYKLQYLALRDKLHQFPKTKFIVLTGAAQVRSQISEDQAKRAKEFFKWVTDEWDLPNDNIFVWDLYQLETEGGYYLKDSYAASGDDSHPNAQFATRAAQLFFNRIVDVIDRNGTETTLTGEKRQASSR